MLFLLLLCQLSGAASSHSVRGHIVEVLADGSFRLENGLRVTLSSSTVVMRGNDLYSGRLVVGFEVNITGRLDSVDATLQAEKIAVLTNLEGQVEGTAVIEERHNASEGVVLVSDGRQLLVTDRTRYLPPKRKELESVDGVEAVQPGGFVHYRGRWAQTGLVEVEELSVWGNRLEEKERKIYQKYYPEMLLPRGKGVEWAVLKVDKNRYRVLDDREIQLYVDRLGRRLLPRLWNSREAASRWGYSFWFIVALHERPQASAFPSGVVVIHSALFHLAENEAQLAFAIAHEIAHVLQEHAWQEYLYHRRKLLLLRWSTAGLGYVVESAIRRGYQRGLEAQADRLALSYMTQAGYDPRESITFLRRLEERQQGLSALLWETHKSYGQRRRALMEELARYSARGLHYRSLKKESGEFGGLRKRIPAAEIDTVRESGARRK